MSSKNVEQIKEESSQLRGTIRESLRQQTANFNEEDSTLLKFHGSYQQDDRDKRIERKKLGQDKAWGFMVRVKLPNGCVSADHYRVLDDLAGEMGNSTLRLTTRQGIQLHYIEKVNLKEFMAKVQRSGMTTWGACGDVVRNTMGPASPLDTPAHRDAKRLADELTQAFLSRSKAYVEIWLDDEEIKLDQIAAPKEIEDPIYGKNYLPRKFKIGIAVPPHNDVDIFSQDIGFVSHVVDGQIEGYTILVGGGLGMTHGMLKTYPVLGKPLTYVKKEHAVAAAVAIVTTQRDYGNREDRKRARLKYLVEEKGIEWFRNEVKSRLNGVPSEDPRPFHFDTVADQIGWHEQGDGKWFCCVPVEVGRIHDNGSVRYRSGFRALVDKFGFPMRVTPNCNLIFHDIAPEQRAAFDKALEEYHIPNGSKLTEAHKSSHACVSLPTCGLALAESERVFPEVMGKIDEILYELKLEKDAVLIRMSGCPNGCSRPYTADFAFVGRGPDRYAFFVGGSISGNRLVSLEKKTVNLSDIPQTVRPYLETFAQERQPNERFSDYWGRTHPDREAAKPEQFHLESGGEES